MKFDSGWSLSIFLCICLLSFNPLPFYPYHASPYQYPKVLYLSLFIFLGLLLWAFDALLAKGKRPTWSPAAVFLLLFILWALIRYPWFAPTHAHLKDPFLWGNLGLTYFLVRQYIKEERRIRILVYLLAGLNIAVCLYGLLQFWGIDLSLYHSQYTIFGSMRPEGRWGRPFATLGNPNFLGEYLAGLLPLLLTLYLISKGKGPTLLWAGATLVSALLIFLSGARGALMAGLGGLLLFFLLERGKGHLRKAIALLLAALVLVSAALLAGGFRSGFSRTWQKVVMASSFSQGSVGARLLWWRVSGEMIRDCPLGGVGTGSFREAYPDFQKRFFQRPDSAPWIPRVALAWKDNFSATLEAPHNGYLQIGAEMGLPGLILFLAFSLLLLLRAARGNSTPSPFWRSGCIAGCSSILIASLFSYPVHMPSTGFLFFLMAGLLDSLSLSSSVRAEGERKGDPLFGTLLVLIACVALLQFIHQTKVFTSGRYLHRAISYQLAHKTELSMAEFYEAKRLNPKDPEVDYYLGLAHLSQGHLLWARDGLMRAKSSFQSPSLYFTLGAISSDLKDYPGAEALLKEGISTYPGLAPLYARLGALYAKTGRGPEALETLQRAKELDPAYGETYHYLGHLLYLMGDPKGALLQFKHFLQLAPPNDPRRALDLSLIKKLSPGSTSQSP